MTGELCFPVHSTFVLLPFCWQQDASGHFILVLDILLQYPDLDLVGFGLLGLWISLFRYMVKGLNLDPYFPGISRLDCPQSVPQPIVYVETKNSSCFY